MSNGVIRAVAWLAIAVLLLPGRAAAIRLEPGSWEVTVRTQNPMTGEQVEKTLVECMDQAAFDPARAMADNAQCTVTEVENSDSLFRWTMECGGDGMPSFYGEGVFESIGRSASGSMTLTMMFAGRTLQMSNQWEGRYVSPACQ